MTELGHKVTVAAPVGSQLSKGVTAIGTVRLPCQQDRDDLAYDAYIHIIEDADVIHDFSHGHVLAKRRSELPSLNVIWDNLTVKYAKAPRNIVALSNWQKANFERMYQQKARLVPTVCANENRYRPDGEPTDRFLIVGKMSPDKGIVEAMKFCKLAGVGADIVGGSLVTDDPTYKYEVMSICDGKQFVYWGEVNDEVKIHLLQRAKAVVNARKTPEAFWHVGIEAMLCGTPAIAFNHSSYPEIVRDGLSGFLCTDNANFMNAIKQVGSLARKNVRQYALRFSRSNVVAGYVKLYEAVEVGEVWV